MKHAIGYLGHYDRNFTDLKPGVQEYQRKDGRIRAVAPRPRNVDGILFWYMERQKKKFVAVRAEYGGHDVVVKNPVPLKPSRHTDGKRFFAPNPSRFGDKSAQYLLDDMISSNRDQAGFRAIAAQLGWRPNEAR